MHQGIAATVLLALLAPVRAEATDPDCTAALAALKPAAVPLDDYFTAFACTRGRPLEKLFSDAQGEHVGTLSQVVAEPGVEALQKCAPGAAAGSGRLWVLNKAATACVSAKKGSEEKLASNRLFAFLTMRMNVRGHREVTREALQEFCKSLKHPCALSGAARAIAGDAAEDPDFYEWSHPEAHAQAPQQPDSPETAPGTDLEHEQLFRHWVVKVLRRARDSCAHVPGSGARKVVYQVGYALHAVQDLAAHRGRTNAEHKYDDEYPDPALSLVQCTTASSSDTCPREQEACGSPDADPCAVQLGQQFTAAALTAVRDYLNGSKPRCFEEAFEMAGAPLGILLPEKEAMGLRWDFTPAAFLSYARLAGLMNALPLAERKKQARRWFRGTDYKDVLDRLLADVRADRAE